MKFFTLQEARALLPQLRVELEQLLDVQNKIRKEWERIADLAGLDRSDPIIVDHLLPNSPEIQLLSAAAREILQRLRVTEVQVKSVEHGLFDFPCLVEDRVVLLCWRYGEEDIEYWHELETGFAGRRPLMEAHRIGTTVVN